MKKLFFIVFLLTALNSFSFLGKVTHATNYSETFDQAIIISEKIVKIIDDHGGFKSQIFTFTISLINQYESVLEGTESSLLDLIKNNIFKKYIFTFQDCLYAGGDIVTHTRRYCKIGSSSYESPGILYISSDKCEDIKGETGSDTNGNELCYLNKDVECYTDDKPVCATNNKTFSNDCEAEKNGRIIDYSGECEAEVECLENGGEYKSLGRAGMYGCILATSDAGKTCTDSDQCEGLCLAENGSCAADSNSFGCIAILEQGEEITMCTD